MQSLMTQTGKTPENNEPVWNSGLDKDNSQHGFRYGGVHRKRPRVLFADDHAVLIEALAHRFQQELEVVGIARDGLMLVEMAKHHKPDIIVTDISMPHLNGIDAARIIRKEVRSARILLLTMHTDLPLIEEAFRAGASGLVLKVSSADEV